MRVTPDVEALHGGYEWGGREVLTVKPSALIRWTLWAFVALTAVLLVPSAFAAVRPDDKAGPLGVGATAIATQPTIPNDRAGALGPGAVTIVVEPTIPNDRAGPLGVGAASLGSQLAEPTVVATSGETSSWYNNTDEILLGVGLVAGLLVLGGVVVLMTRQHGGPARPVPH